MQHLWPSSHGPLLSAPLKSPQLLRTSGEGVEGDLVLLALGAHLLANLQAREWAQPGRGSAAPLHGRPSCHHMIICNHCRLPAPHACKNAWTPPAALPTCHMWVWSILPMGQREKRSTALTTDLISLPQATASNRGGEVKQG